MLLSTIRAISIVVYTVYYVYAVVKTALFACYARRLNHRHFKACMRRARALTALSEH